jgi:hypothetical protein
MRKRDKSHNLAGEVITRNGRRKRDTETSVVIATQSPTQRVSPACSPRRTSWAARDRSFVPMCWQKSFGCSGRSAWQVGKNASRPQAHEGSWPVWCSIAALLVGCGGYRLQPNLPAFARTTRRLAGARPGSVVRAVDADTITSTMFAITTGPRGLSAGENAAIAVCGSPPRNASCDALVS